MPAKFKASAAHPRVHTGEFVCLTLGDSDQRFKKVSANSDASGMPIPTQTRADALILTANFNH